MHESEPQATSKGNDQPEAKRFKTMNIGEYKKPSKTETPAPTQAPMPDFGLINPAFAQFPFNMFAGMGGMNGMNGMGGLPFQGFGFPFMMGQTPLQPKTSSHGNKRVFVQNMVSLPSYTDERLIREKFDCLREMNDPKFKVDQIKDAEFFIIRSSNDDDFHKAVKYGVWSSSQKNNHVFQDSYQSGHRKDGKTRPVYFFFTVVNSDQYMGVAQMTSDVDFSKSFGYWWENSKWTGVFRIKWVFVKDVEYSQFTNLSSGDKPVTQNRDGTRLDFNTGIKMLKVFEQSKSTESIFNAFTYMDEREEKLRLARLANEVQNADSDKQGKYHGHRGERNHRERGGDRDGYYRKSNRYSNSGSEYHPKRREGGSRRDYEEREERSEEKPLGIVIQKKAPKQKKTRGKGGHKDKASSSDLYEEKKTAPVETPAKTTTTETPVATDKTVDLPTTTDA